MAREGSVKAHTGFKIRLRARPSHLWQLRTLVFVRSILASSGSVWTCPTQTVTLRRGLGEALSLLKNPP